MRFLSFFAFVFAFFSASPVLAHWGHVGELAGHGHAIAIGALIGAAALAAALLKPKDQETVEDDEVEDVNAEGEAV